MFGSNLFDVKPLIDPDCEVIFVADLFVEDYGGGAELTTQALIDECPFKIMKLHSQHVTLETLKAGHDKFWIFANFANLNSNLIPTIVGNMRYAIAEFDFKFCRHRSPEKHEAIEGKKCDCAEQMNGKIVSAFFHGAQSLWWMSEKQMQIYHNLFPFLTENENFVLSSVFSKKTLATIKALRESEAVGATNYWIVLGSQSWIKGFDAAKKWCEENTDPLNRRYSVVWNMPYEDLLTKLSYSRGLVYLPPGMDTCPRLVIEAKLLRCQLQLNDNVLHKDEEWFATDDLEQIESYLYKAPQIFWNGIKANMEYEPTISGYVTTYNCEKQGYPYKQCIQSMLEFCDEICVLDGGSDDGTWESLQTLSCDPKLVIKQNIVDWSHPRFAVQDGLQKGRAREMCTKDFCLQVDADEIFYQDDGPKFKELARNIGKGVDLVALPVVEFWGPKKEKVRIDVMPWKWRFSRNKSNITHGIPKELQAFDENGDMYALQGTDGCCYVDRETSLRISFLNFYNQDIDNLRRNALMEHEPSIREYERWFNAAIEQMPSVFHYSWVDFERKIRLYRDTWTRHWQSLYNLSIEDTAENNMFFNCKWSEVTDEMITKLAGELEKTGGKIFHSKWNGEHTPHLTITRSEPACMLLETDLESSKTVDARMVDTLSL